MADLHAVEEDAAPKEDIRGVFTDVAEAEVVPPRYVIKDFLPVGLCILGSPPKSGKSTITYGWAALVAGYGCKVFPDSLSEVAEEGAVFAFSGEALAGEIRHTLEKGLGVQLVANEGIIVADDPWAWQLDNEDQLKRLIWWLNRRHPKLVLLDPFRNFHSQDEKDSAAMVKLLLPLRQWAVENDAAVVIVHHTTKPGEDTKVYDAHKLRGSGAIFGMADSVIMVTPMGQMGQLGRVKMQAIFKRGQGWERELQLAAWGSGRAEEVLGEVERMMLQVLQKGALTAEEIGERVGVRKGAGPYIARLEKNGHIKKLGRKWVLAGRDNA